MANLTATLYIAAVLHGELCPTPPTSPCGNLIQRFSVMHARKAPLRVSLDGTWVRPDNEAMLAMYDPNARVRDVLLGNVPPPSSAHTFPAAVHSAAYQEGVVVACDLGCPIPVRL